MATTATWTGLSGQKYTFEVFSIETDFNPVSAVYIVGPIRAFGMEAFYVGETQSLLDRLNAGAANHDGMKRAKALGATHVAVMLVSNHSERLRIETDLRHGIDPVCNRQGVTNPASLFYRQ